MHQPGSFTAQTQGGKGVRNQAEDFGHSGTKHLRISGSTFLRLLDVGLSKLCPKTNSQFRFARSLQVKTKILFTKVIRDKVVEEIELIYVHCFTTWEYQIKIIKIKENLPQSLQNNFLSRPLYFCNKFRSLDAIGLFSAKSGINHWNSNFSAKTNSGGPRDHWHRACPNLCQNFQNTKQR